MRRTPWGVVLGLFLIVGVSPVCLGAKAQERPRSSQASAATRLPDFASLVSRVASAVVHVAATHSVDPRDVPPDHGGPASSDEDSDEEDQGPMQSEGDVIALGSGFIVSKDGYVLTNAHVVAGAKEVVVTLRDKRDYPAEVVAVDAPTDVALVKIPAHGLPKVTIGNPTKLKVGDWVAAIGSPFGFDYSVTKGIVSAVGRALPDETYVPFIQTDAALNPGNSGGPLFNMKGEVVGINSQIYSRNGGFMGISFAIPIDVAMDVSKQLLARGKVTRSRLGVAVREVTPQLARSLSRDNGKGALVIAVQKDGPADKAGVEPGDIIVRYGKNSIEQATDLPRLVAGTRPGASVKVQVWRNGQTKDSTVVVEEAS